MKRSLFIIPFILLLLLNACVGSSAQIQLAVDQTLTALVWTPTVTPNPINIPNSQHIVNLLNIEPPKDLFSTEVERLEHTIGAMYEVLEVEFPTENGEIVFQVDVRCVCGAKAGCCNAERMFVLTMLKMYPYRDQITTQMPASVRRLTVMCYERTIQFDSISADWEDVKSFLYGKMDGRQFGFGVRWK